MDAASTSSAEPLQHPAVAGTGGGFLAAWGRFFEGGVRMALGGDASGALSF